MNVEFFDNEDLSGIPKTQVDQHLTLGQSFDISTIDFSEIDFANLLTYTSSAERWTGYYVPKASGSFDIFVQQGGFSPSGFRMYVEDKLLFDSWDNQKFILMTPWIGRVPAVIEAWYPGQEGGTALAEILFGDVNPSGHLAATFEKHWEDNPTA